MVKHNFEVYFERANFFLRIIPLLGLCIFCTDQATMMQLLEMEKVFFTLKKNEGLDNVTHVTVCTNSAS